MAGNYEMTFADYWRVIRKWKWMILFLTIMVGGLAVVYAELLPEVYVSSGQVKVVSYRIDEALGAPARRTIVSQVEMETAQEIAKSEGVLQYAAKMILQNQEAHRFFQGDPNNVEDLAAVSGILAREVNVRRAGNSNTLEFQSRSNNPDKARIMVDAMLNAFVDMERSENQRVTRELVDWLDQRIVLYADSAAYYRGILNDIERDELRSNLSPNTQVRLSEAGQIVAGIQSSRDELARITSEIERLRALSLQADLTYEQAHARAPLSSSTRQMYDQLRQTQNRLESLKERYTDNYPPVREAEEQVKQLNEELQNLIRIDIANAVAAKEAQMEGINAEIARLQQRRDTLLHMIDELPLEQQRQAYLEQELSKYQNLVNNFLGKKQQIEMAQASVVEQEMDIIARASRPGKPTYPRKETIWVSGVLIGLFLGLAGAFLRESMDTSMATIEDVEQYIEKPVVAVIPTIRPSAKRIREYQAKNKAEKAGMLVSMVDPRAPATEAYRTLRTNLLSTFFDEDHKLLAITSATPQEGKTTTSVNLAVTMANVGKKTLVVGCNLRHPSLSDYFPINNALGIQSIIDGSKTIEEAIQPSGIENLDVLDSGGYLHRPSEVLENAGMDLILSELKERYEVVLLDTPPVLPVTDAAVLARKVDGVLLVYYFGVAAREVLLRAKVQLETVGTNIIGVLLNDIKAEGEKLNYAYYYYYSHRYAGSGE